MASSVINDVNAPGEEQLDLAKRLVEHLESGKEEDAVGAIAQLAGFGDSLMYHEVGRLTRELHESIKGFVVDSKIASIANSEMPDAAERLHYVITMTEDAANTTLSAVEDALPVADQLHKDSVRLSDQWNKFNSRQMNVDDFRVLSGDISKFLETSEANSKAINDKLSEILMAQGYQDLTGQVIRKVIDLVQDVEGKLVELVKISGQKAEEPEEKKGTKEPDITAHGPMVPGVDKMDSVDGQDDVDDLLASLGF